MWELNDLTSETLDMLEQKIRLGMIAVGDQAENDVMRNTPVDTGNLKSKITHVTDDKVVTVGTNVEYAQAVELGHVQEPGRYVPAIGKRLVSDWVPGQHFMRDALQRNSKNYERILSAALRTH